MTKTVSFDRSLYLPEAVDAAAAVYADYAQIVVTPGPEATEVVVTADDEDVEVVLHSFCNHVLYESITRMRQAAHAEVL